MSTQLNGLRYETESVIPFAPNTKSVPANDLDKAGQTILQLLHKAADVAEDNSRHALEMAQKLSHQLRTAEDRITELEAEAETYREESRTSRAMAAQSLRRQSEDRRRTTGGTITATVRRHRLVCQLKSSRRSLFRGLAGWSTRGLPADVD
jgi:hypothetical protein